MFVASVVPSSTRLVLAASTPETLAPCVRAISFHIIPWCRTDSCFRGFELWSQLPFGAPVSTYPMSKRH
jgi:hypothetical protein